MKTPKKQTEWKPTKINEDNLVKNIKKYLQKGAEKKTKILKENNNYEKLVDLFIEIFTD